MNTYARGHSLFSKTILNKVLLMLGCLLILGALGCGGSKVSGDHAGQINGPFLITPATSSVLVNQVVQFSASSPWGTGASWSVFPATGGAINGSGKFTASTTPGQYQIVAMWNQDVRYTATATAWVVAAPVQAPLHPGMVQAFGHRQTSPDGSIHNAPVAGEPVHVQAAVNEPGALLVRHGFHLPPPR